MTTHTKISAAGRDLVMRGTVPIYLQWFTDWGADYSAIYAATKDVPSGSTVIDVGANIGMMSCSLATQRPDLSIIAFEPVPDNFECLIENIRVNGLNNIEAINAAVRP